MFRSKQSGTGIEYCWDCTLGCSAIQPSYDRLHERWPVAAHLVFWLFTDLKTFLESRSFFKNSLSYLTQDLGNNRRSIKVCSLCVWLYCSEACKLVETLSDFKYVGYMFLIQCCLQEMPTKNV